MSKWTMVRVSRGAHEAMKARAESAGCSVSAFLDREFIPAVERAKPRARAVEPVVAVVEPKETLRDAIHEDGRAAAEAVVPEVPACRECERPGSVSAVPSRRHGPRCRYFDRTVP